MFNGYYTATSVGILQSNTGSQNSDAIEAWLESIPQMESAVLQFDVSSDLIQYDFARTIIIQKPLALLGTSGGRSTYASYLKFPADTTGIWIKSSGGTSPNFRGDNCLIQNLAIVGAGGTTGTTGHGILMQGRAHIRDVWVVNFRLSGVAILASSGDSPATNANVWSISNVASTSNGEHGFYIDGADANAGTAISCDASSNLGYGFYDSSFLGNTYVGCHTEANVKGSYVAEDVNARCLYLGCYVEGGQPLPDLRGSRSTWLGGLAEGRIIGGSLVYKDGIADTLNARAAGLNRWGSVESVTLGSAPQSSLQSFVTFSTTEDGAFPLSICYFDKAKQSHKFVWYSTSGSQTDGVTIASLNSENSGRLVPPGMWGFPNGHFMSTKRFDAASAVPSAARLWNIGDVRWNTSTAAGAPAGWTCTDSGMAGSYAEGRTATATGATVITLSAASNVLNVGDLIDCNGTVGAAITTIGEYASGTVTCAGVQAGDTVTIAGTVFAAVTGAATLGDSTFSKDTGDNATAASLALQVTNHKDTHGVTDFFQYVAANASTNVVTFTTHVKGTSGNSYGLVSSNGTRLAVTGAGTLTGGDDGTKVALDTAVPAGTGLAITYKAATFAEFGHCIGGTQDDTASSGTTATQNTRKGRVAISAGNKTMTVTNSRVTTASVIHASLQSVDQTLTKILSVVPGSGSFVINCDANATGTTNICWSLEE